MKDHAESPKHPRDIIDGEVIAEFSDDTLMNLPPAGHDLNEKVSSAETISGPRDPGRRQLIIRLLIGGGAALALGGSAALLLNRPDQPSVVILPNGSQISGQGSVDVASLVKQISDLQESLKKTTDDRDQLRAQYEQLTAEYSAVKPALDNAQALNSLWKSLDDIGIDDLLSAALSVLQGTLGAIMSIAAILRSGVEVGQKAVDYVANNIAKPQSGMQWLSTQTASLSSSLDDLSTKVQQAIEPVQPYAQMISNFVDWVLNQLPFNIGARAKAGLDGMQVIVAGLPDLVAKSTSDVLDPLAVWFGSDPLRNLTGILLNPLGENVITPGRNLVDNLYSFNQSFKDLLVDPMSDALARRSKLRMQIQQLQRSVSG